MSLKPWLLMLVAICSSIASGAEVLHDIRDYGAKPDEIGRASCRERV